jgi:hypothetical protein
MEILISETRRRFKWIPSGNYWLVAFDCVLIILFIIHNKYTKYEIFYLIHKRKKKYKKS